MISAEWMFALVSACQRFICVTADAPWNEIGLAVSTLVASVPEPASACAALVLQSTLLELALRWGSERHRRVRAHCRDDRCLQPLYGRLATEWSRTDVVPIVRFERWVTEYCDTLAPTHPDPVAPWVASWIRSHAEQPLNVPGLAQQFHIDAWRLRREFRCRMGMSLREYHTRARVALAEQLARQSGAKVEWVALEAGWRSKKNVYRAVRHVRGCTPAALRDRRAGRH